MQYTARERKAAQRPLTRARAGSRATNAYIREREREREREGERERERERERETSTNSRGVSSARLRACLRKSRE